MDSKQFMKLCRDSGIIGGKLNPTAVDLVFTKAKSQVGGCGRCGQHCKLGAVCTCGF